MIRNHEYFLLHVGCRAWETLFEQDSDYRRRGRVGDAILQLRKQKDVSLGATAIVGMRCVNVNVMVSSTIRCA
jgi:hypothetical protein